MGRKLPKKYGYSRDTSQNLIRNLKFPECIGRFPECKEYTANMNLEDRPECKLCPFRS